MKHVGIFLAFSPVQPLKNQGISRLLAFVLDGMLKNPDIKIVIATPAWGKEPIIEFLQDQRIETARLEFLTTSRIPYLLRIGKIFSRKKKSVQAFQSHRKKSLLKNPINIVKSNLLARKLYEKLRTRELKKLAAEINKRQDISVWFVPSLYWPEIKFIQAKKVVAAPDVIFVDFSNLFLHKFSAQAYHQMTETIKVTDHFICYSDYVKQKHLIEPFNVKSDKISIIPHGMIDLSHYFDSAPGPGAEALIVRRNAATRILDQYQEIFLQHCLNDFVLSNTRYIFYSSQMRLYKNFITLIKAYEILLRRRALNIKLIVTADLAQDEEVYNYIMNKRLQRDVISLTNVSSEVLAALNHLSLCAVNPTLFEGGFPFTFTEAYSVGTPSLMSHIPVVISEVTEKELQQKMLFDPLNVEDMVDKIAWAVENRELLYSLQEPLYKKFKQRTWDVVAKEYVDLL